VVVSGIRSPGAKPAVVLRAAGVSFRLAWPPGIVADCLRVLAYPRIAKILAPTGRQEYACRVVAGLAASADVVPPELLPNLRAVKGANVANAGMPRPAERPVRPLAGLSMS